MYYKNILLKTHRHTYVTTPVVQNENKRWIGRMTQCLLFGNAEAGLSKQDLSLLTTTVCVVCLLPSWPLSFYHT